MTSAAAPGQSLRGLDTKGAFEAVVKAVSEDEPCFLLAELNLLTAGSMARHRYQVLKVVRADKLVTAYVDLGLASAFKKDEFTIPGGQVDQNGKGHIWSTVGELRQIADEMRVSPLRREINPPDIIGNYNKLIDETERLKARSSTYGYGGDA